MTNDKQRERLVELLVDSETAYAQYLSEACDKAIKGDVTVQLMKRLEFYADRLLADGWMRPPCKIGQTVYEITPNLKYINERVVVGFHLGCFPTLRGHKRKPYLVCYDKISKYLKHIPLDRIGKTVFLSREEAEQALKGGAE